MYRAVLALAAGALLAGCHDAALDTSPSCAVVAAKFLELVRDDLTHGHVKMDEATSRAITDQLPALGDALVRACDAGKWNQAIRSCLVRANDQNGLETCELQLTDEQRRDLGRGLMTGPAVQRSEPTSIAPSGP